MSMAVNSVCTELLSTSFSPAHPVMMTVSYMYIIELTCPSLLLYSTATAQTCVETSVTLDNDLSDRGFTSIAFNSNMEVTTEVSTGSSNSATTFVTVFGLTDAADVVSDGGIVDGVWQINIDVPGEVTTIWPLFVS